MRWLGFALRSLGRVPFLLSLPCPSLKNGVKTKLICTFSFSEDFLLAFNYIEKLT